MSPEKLQKALAVTDLSDPNNGIHAINLVVSEIERVLGNKAGWPTPEIIRRSPISTIENEFDRLYFPADNPSRSSTYTRYVDQNRILRTHTSSAIPNIIAERSRLDLQDYLVLVPGICFRRDVVDREHTGEPHQMDIWRIKKGEPKLKRPELVNLIETIVEGLFPGTEYRANEVKHPYTINGLEVEIKMDYGWLELLECGEVHPRLLKDSGLDPDHYSGLAMGMGLDRLVMVVKEIDDIRLLRSQDPRIQEQMQNLNPYTPVSKFPPIKQDMSISVYNHVKEEDICERIRDTLGSEVDVLEEVKILSETPYEALPPKAVERLGILPDQKNLLVRIMLRSHDRTLLQEEANELRDTIYQAIDQSKTGGYLNINT